ncbi:hypothetical protein G5I_01134 [Acromyrmex echinatior]|uniref:Uncharacterized protein n=1 Tax=Acromyrmex echinatior TaxID=103372 RepID=F4W6S9_ACREC|nr:hypothetical protein G5I_01134 [Acromyrmex echinatior]
MTDTDCMWIFITHSDRGGRGGRGGGGEGRGGGRWRWRRREEKRRAEAAAATTAAAAAAATAAAEEEEEDEEEEEEEEGPCQPACRPNRASFIGNGPALCFGWIAADAIPSSILLRCVSRYGPGPGAIEARVVNDLRKNKSD